MLFHFLLYVESQGGIGLDIVLILRNGTLSVTRLNAKGNNVTVVDHTKYNHAALLDDLSDAERTQTVLQSVLNVEKDKECRFFVVFAPGSGLVYKTWQAALSSFRDVSDKTLADKEDRVLSLCKDNLPDGLTELYDSYTPSLVSCYEDDTCTASSCYIPTVFLDNLKTACNNLGLTLFKVTDVSSTFLPIFDTSRGQLFIHSNGLITAMNEFGSMSWLLPETCNDAMFQYFAGLTEKYFPLQDALEHSHLVIIERSEEFLKINLANESLSDTEDALVSAGCVVDMSIVKTKGTNRETEGSEVNGAFGKLRKLFEKK